MAMVRVEHEYTATEPDELTIHKGDIIREVLKKSGGWWEGVLNDKKGLFPDNFVKIIDKDPMKENNRKCRVIFSYNQDHEDELSLNVGDLVEILGEEEEGWWRGLLNGKEGVFPSNFVEEIPQALKSIQNSQEDLTSLSSESDSNCPSLPPKPAKILCKVNYAYKAQNDDELDLNQGDIVTLINRDGQDPGWWKGELNGVIGVFPDNFVSIISSSADDRKDDSRKSAKSQEVTVKPFSVATQRLSLELKKDKDNDHESVKVSPPIPGKKPTVPIKKSPSSSSSSSGIFAGLKRKLADVVDGASNSKSVNNHHKSNEKLEKSDENENAFDQVERNSLLSDLRATRAKAPGRRPPSTIFKDGEAGVMNGNSDHLDNLNSSNSSVEQEITEQKPKVREWEKHKAPWLEEMKLNQAKRTSTSPGPEQNKLKLTPDKLEEESKNKTSPFESATTFDMSKSMPSLSTKLKTPPGDLERSTPPAIIRNKPPQIVQSAVRPTTINNAVDSNKLKKSPIVAHKKISPILKPQATERVTDFKSIENQHECVACTQHVELLERIHKLEGLVEKQNQAHKVAIENLKGKMQMDSDMIILLQAEVDKLSQCVMQV